MNEPTHDPAAVRTRTITLYEWARLKGIEDVARLVVDGNRNGYPVSDGSWENDLIDRLETALEPVVAAPQPEPETTDE